MPRIIKHDRIVEDDWQVLTLAEARRRRAVALPADPVLLPLPVWLARRDEISRLYRTLGVWLDSHEGPEALADDIDRLSRHRRQFPEVHRRPQLLERPPAARALSLPGEIRAIGDVLQDQLFYMRRCGIDAYALRADKDIEKALAGLSVFSETYQAAVDQPQPLFRGAAQASA
jgi:uncharacterized protein (DUF934 family)